MAMIFAAGLGTRLGDYTKNRPKALVKVSGYSLLDAQIRKMYAFGIRNIVVNVHHFAAQLIEFLDHYPKKDIKFLISDESDILLDTGGGLKKAASLFTDNTTVLLQNVDVLSDLDFNILEKEFHGDCMLMLKDRQSSRKLLFDADMCLCGWRNNQTREQIDVVGAKKEAYELSYSGIALMKSSFAMNLPGKGVFPIIPALLKAAVRYEIKGCVLPHKWIDVGKIHELDEAEKHMNDYFKKWMI